MYLFFAQNPLLLGKEWDPVERALFAARARYPQLTVGALGSLIHVGRNESRIALGQLSVADIAREVDIPYPTMARHMDVLSNGLGGRGGLGLMKKVDGHGKARVVSLTQEGVAFLSELYCQFAPKDAARLRQSKPSDGSVRGGG